MRNKILIVSHNYHTFLLNEIDYASRIFESVTVIAAYENQLIEKFSHYPNVHLKLFSKTELKKYAISTLYKVFSYESLQDIYKAISSNVFGVQYLRLLTYYLSFDRLVENVCKSLNIENHQDEWVVLAAWYSCPAYSVANLKRKNPNLYAASLAHSFEVDKRKTKYTDVLFRYSFNHDLDLTSFISRNVLEEYIDEHAEKLGLDRQKFEVRYLGTKKNLNGYNCGNISSDCIKIASCSYIVPVKRVELIFEAVKEIEGYRVEWTHMGAGDGYQVLKEKVGQFNAPGKIINLVGAVNNAQVHEFLQNTPLDVFINVSASEGIPVSIMEALAYGVPVIATDVGGNSEIVDSKCGTLISENPSIEEIIEAVQKIKNSDWKVITAEAKTKFETLYNSDRIREQFYVHLSQQ